MKLFLAIIFLAAISISSAPDSNVGKSADEGSLTTNENSTDGESADKESSTTDENSTTDGESADKESSTTDENSTTDDKSADKESLTDGTSPVSPTTVTTAAPVYTCPAGYKLEGSRCRQLVEGYRFRCPATRGGNREGTRCVLHTQDCPIGYKLVEKQQMCEMDENYPGTPECNKSYSLDAGLGFCSKEFDRVDSSKHCQRGTVKKGNMCSYVDDEAIAVCPETGKKPDDCSSRRFFRRRYDSLLDCEPPYRVDPKDNEWCEFIPGSNPLSCMFIGYYVDEKTKMCKTDKKDFPQEQRCWKGELVGGQCITRIRKPSKCSCPELSSMDDNNNNMRKLQSSSVKKTRSKPILLCFEGIMSRGSCMLTRSVQAVLSCPKGFSPDSDGRMCESVNTISATIVVIKHSSTPTTNSSLWLLLLGGSILFVLSI